MTDLTYKGYSGNTEYSPNDGVFHGRVQGIAALVNYEADSAESLRPAFAEAVDDYLELCETEGLTAETP